MRERKRNLDTVTAVYSQFDNLSGPADFWLGNTSPSTSPEQIRQVLNLCSSDMNIDRFTILDTGCLTKQDNPQSRSWKGTVPSRLRDVMSDPQMYL